MEFYHTARQLREEITNMLLRDFGVRDKIRKERTADNTELTIIEEYPAWLITYFRTNILNILFNLTENITAGNSIYPVNDDELYLWRRCMRSYRFIPADITQHGNAGRENPSGSWMRGG
jgi:hypothetical protein